MHPHSAPHEPHFVHLSWAVRRLTTIQAKYIRLFYGESASRPWAGWSRRMGSTNSGEVRE
jgi:hypothetical protein